MNLGRACTECQGHTGPATTGTTVGCGDEPQIAKEGGGWRLLTSAGNQKIVPLLPPHAPVPPAPPLGWGTQTSLGSVVCRVQAPSAEQRLEEGAWSQRQSVAWDSWLAVCMALAHEHLIPLCPFTLRPVSPRKAPKGCC